MNDVIQSRLLQAFDKYSSRTAVEYRGKCISYYELDAKSRLVANDLAARGIGKGSHVAVLTEDKVKLIHTMLGIIRAGCVFVPLDNAYPVDRLKQMLDASNTHILISDNIITAEMLLRTNDRLLLLEMDAFPRHASNTGESNFSNIVFSPEDSIYIFFTSGTTGTPKAIVGQNKSLLHFLRWEIKTFGVNENSRVSQLTSQCHDPFLRDVFVPLLAGGTLCIPPSKEAMLSTGSLAAWLEKSQVELVHCTPSVFRLLTAKTMSGDRLAKLKYILLAGEKIIPHELVNWYNTFGERIQLVNLYGPTETTLAKMYYFIKEADTARNNMPIGRPIDGCKVIVVDKNMKICSSGEVGEILIRTPYRTLGYYNDPELNGKKFIRNPFSTDSNDIVFRTGDMGRVLPEGDIEFLGRQDRQIKIRGFRVELEEIENEMLKYPEINRCAVLYKERSNSFMDETDSVKCKKCGLTSSYRDVSIDGQGVCSICTFYESSRTKAESYFKTVQDLKQLLRKEERNEKKNYDCMLLYSGGKDSTYVLHQLVDMGLRVLAYTFDNGYISKTALENISRTVKELKVDHIVDSYDRMKEVFLEGLKAEYSVCNGCFKVLLLRSNRLAWEKRIEYIVTGFSRGQIFDLRLYEIFKQEIFDVEEVEHKIFEQRLLYHSKEDYVTKVLGSDFEVNKEKLESVKLVDFFRYSDVTKAEILEYLKGRGGNWSSPQDTGFCSSNCLINDVGIYLQREKMGYDNYTFPTSWEVRTGHEQLERIEGEYEGSLDMVKIGRIMKELGYDPSLSEAGSPDGYLAAYFTSGGEIDELDLTAHLQQRLPAYMIPTYFMKIESMPVTANGKLDYKGLPDPRSYNREKYAAPRTETERGLEKIWCEILGIEQVSVTEDFFKMGVHSLKVMNLIAGIYEHFEVEFPLKEFFGTPTIEAVAKYIEEVKTGSRADSLF